MRCPHPHLEVILEVKFSHQCLWGIYNNTTYRGRFWGSLVTQTDYQRATHGIQCRNLVIHQLHASCHLWHRRCHINKYCFQHCALWPHMDHSPGPLHQPILTIAHAPPINTLALHAQNTTHTHTHTRTHTRTHAHSLSRANAHAHTPTRTHTHTRTHAHTHTRTHAHTHTHTNNNIWIHLDLFLILVLDLDLVLVSDDLDLG